MLKLSLFLSLVGFIWHMPPGSYGLYEDQVGKFDWRQQYVGQASFLEFESSAVGGKRVLVSTEENVLAAISSRNGQLVWRQVFEKGINGRMDDTVQIGSSIIVTLGGGTFVRSFSASTGDLVWELNLSSVDPKIRARLAVLGSDQDSSLVVLAGGGLVVAVDPANGAQLWVNTLPNRDSVSYNVLAAGVDHVTAVGVVAGVSVSTVTFDDQGAQLSAHTLPAGWITPDTSCAVVGESFVCLDARSATIYSVSLKKGQQFESQTLQDIGLPPADGASLFTFSAKAAFPNHFGVRLSLQHVAIVKVQAGRVSLVREFKLGCIVDLATLGDKKLAMVLEKGPVDTIHLRTYDLETKEEVQDMTLSMTYPDHHGNPRRLVSYIYRRKDGVLGMRLLVHGNDHSLVMIQQSGRVAWTREESLASIVSVEMVDLPVSPILAKMEDEFGSEPGSSRMPSARSSSYNVLGMFLKRFTTQLAQLKDLVLLIKHKIRLPRHHHHHHQGGAAVLEEEEEDDDEEDDEDYLTRDEFNLHKMIVAVTAAGKIFGMDSFTGRLVWRRLITGMGPFSSPDGSRLMPLYILRSTAHFPLSPLATVVATDKSSGRGFLFSFDPITGASTDSAAPSGQILNYEIRQVYQLTHFDENFMKPLVLLGHNNKFDVVPSSDRAFVADLASQIFVFTTDLQQGTLQGYAMSVQAEELVASPVWSVNLFHDGQTITNVAVKRANEHVHSQGVVLGDRSVLYKYINPNLVAITTEGNPDTEKAYVGIYLVDAVTGQVVFHCSHRKAKGPVHIVHSENWIVYNYWNMERGKWRTEIGVLELYEGPSQSNSTAFSSLTPPPTPTVVRQSFIFPVHIATMATTLTEMGLTSKQVLIALESGGILGMPKMWLDPRRPLVPTIEHKEEGIMPYMPELMRPFEGIINYNQSVANIRGVHSAPAGLESTSLVLVYGLDLYYTRVMPSKMFDVLKDDFDYFFIASVLAGMIAVSVISRKLAAKKALNRAWK